MMSSPVDPSIGDPTWLTTNWYPSSWDTETLSTNTFNCLNGNELKLEPFNGDIDLLEFSDMFRASNDLGLGLNRPELVYQSRTPPADETHSASQSPQNMDMLDGLVTDVDTASESTPPSILEHHYSPPTPTTGTTSTFTSVSASRRSSRASHDSNSQSRQKALHNAVERRYRDNMNTKFLALAQRMPKIYGHDAEVVMGRKPPKRKAGELYQSKTDVLDNALSYIDQLHREKKALTAQVATLKSALQTRRTGVRRTSKPIIKI